MKEFMWNNRSFVYVFVLTQHVQKQSISPKRVKREQEEVNRGNSDDRKNP